MSVTRETARSRVQRRIGDSSGNFYGNTLYNDIIEQATMLWGGVIARLTPSYYLEHTAYTGVDDAADSDYEFYNFPANYRTFVQLERQYGSGAGVVYRAIRRVNSEDQDRYKYHDIPIIALPDSLSSSEETVSIWGNQFRILPAPVNNSYEYRLKYLRRPITLAADESNLDVPDEWVEVIVLDSAYQVLSQLGDMETAGMIRDNLDRVAKMLKDEYRNQAMGIEGVTYLDQIG